jgi:hypothetical protein
MGNLNNRAALKANGKLGSNLPVSIAFVIASCTAVSEPLSSLTGKSLTSNHTSHGTIFV